MTLLNSIASHSTDTVSTSGSSSEDYSIREGRPPIRKMDAQDFGPTASAKSLFNRINQQQNTYHEGSSQYSCFFKYHIKTSPNQLIRIESNDALKACLSDSPQKDSLKSRVLKISRTDLTVTQFSSLIFSLSLTRCKSITFHEKLKPSFETLSCLGEKTGSLEHIDFAGVKFKTRKDQEGLVSLIKKNKETLENINLSDCMNLDHRVLLAIFDCKKLKALNLSNVRTYYDLNNFDNPPRSTEMDAFKEHLEVRSTFLFMLFKSCPKLQHLNISTFISPFNHRQVVEFLESTNPVPLKTFICNYVEWIGENNILLQELTSHFPNLETLSLSSAGRLTNMPYYPTKLPKLLHLDLSGQDHIPFSFIKENVSHFSQLESLNLSFCHNLPSFPLAIFLLRNGRNLKELNIDITTFLFKNLITLLKGLGPSIEELLHHMALEQPIMLPDPIKGIGEQLTSLTISTKFLTSARIQEILSLCPNLVYLNEIKVSRTQK